MYEAHSDPDCYAGTAVLKNKMGLRDPHALERFEIAMTLQRGAEPMPVGRLDSRHYCAVHRHLFGDIYRWAGRYRTVRIEKGGNRFCHPEYIALEMERLFRRLTEKGHFVGLAAGAFSTEAAGFLADLNAIHPFREGNGRAQFAFLILLSANAGFRMDVGRLKPEDFLAAMIASFRGRPPWSTRSSRCSGRLPEIRRTLVIGR